MRLTSAFNIVHVLCCLVTDCDHLNIAIRDDALPEESDNEDEEDPDQRISSKCLFETFFGHF